MINSYMNKGLIKRVSRPTLVCSPSFFVPKPHDRTEPRLVIDYKPVNNEVLRPHHPSSTPEGCWSQVPVGAKWFITMDMSAAYLTSFIFPEGKIQWTRLPMGLNASMDLFNESMDRRLKDFPGLENVIKEVDDFLIHGNTLEELVKQLDAFFDFCQLYNITLAPNKLQFSSDNESVVFAGFKMSSDGYSQDPGRMDSIRLFKTPETKSQLKSWLGLTAQVSLWHPEVSEGQSRMRLLLRNDTAWLWTQEMDNKFKAMRTMLCSKKYVKPFDTSLTPNILVDT
jgi:hypothetical protein